MNRVARFRRGVFSWVCGLALISGAPGASWASARWDASYFPNVPLVNQDGKTVRFYDDLIQGKVVAINFFFTHCKYMCPAETANLRRVEKILGDRVGKDVHFYSISIDPKVDTPAELKEFSKKFGAGPGWTFLRGKESDVALIRKKLGLYRENAGDEDPNNHTVSFMVGNEATGIWIKRSTMDNPKTLARLLGSMLQGRGGNPIAKTNHVQMASSPDYSKARQTARPSKAEELFRSRCAACHSMGSDDGIGPGLAGVTRKRERAWLVRWLKVPDEMLAAKDPIATSLFERYQKVAMPNLKLSDKDVRELIEFMAKPAGS